MILEMERVGRKKDSKAAMGYSSHLLSASVATVSVVGMVLKNSSFMAKTDVSSRGFFPYSCFTQPQTCAWGGQPEASGPDLRIKVVFRHCCPWGWDGPGLDFFSLTLRSGLASSRWLEPGIRFYFWSLMLRWKSKQSGNWRNKQPSQN